MAVELFQKFKASGQKHILVAIIDQERSHLYDYAMRMLGLQRKALEALEQLADRYIAKSDREPDDLKMLRVDLYRELRRSQLEGWNAVTDDLENEVLTGMQRDNPDHRLSLQLDEAFRRLAGPEREVSLLCFVRGFTFDEAAHIMGVSSQRAADLSGLALQRLDLVFKEKVPFPESFSHLLAHPTPEVSAHATVAVSQLIRNVSNAKKIYSPLKQLRWAFGVVILLVIALILAWPYLAPHVSSSH